ncbi:MAG: hypothetical protein D6790_15425, partial [Caldilineae bacterium]
MMGEARVTIARVQVFPVLLPMIRSFTFASGSAGEAGGKAPHVFVKITDSEGAHGWGECRPVPGWNYESLETVTATLRRIGPALLGHPVSDRWGLHRAFHRLIGRGPSDGQPLVRAALDMALHDLLARRAGMSLRAFLGGDDARSRMELSYTLTGHDRASIQEEMDEGKALGFRHFNFKAAVAPETDVEVAQTVAEQIPPGGFVWADANQGFQLHDARWVAQVFGEIGVDLLEQP